MAANCEPSFASPIRSLIALKPLLNWSRGMEPDSSMMKTTSYSGKPRSTDPDIGRSDVASALEPVAEATECVAEALLLPLGLERLGSREKGLLEDGRLRRRKGRFLASLLAVTVSIFDGFEIPKIRSINEVNNYLQIPCERWLISRLPAFQRYSKNQRRFLVRVRIIKYSSSTGQVSLLKTCILSTAIGMNLSSNSFLLSLSCERCLSRTRIVQLISFFLLVALTIVGRH